MKSSALATYAVSESNSKGRTFSEAHPADRNEFERDRSRILHSKAWRKLQYKTQVFANDQGDCFRTRSSHSLEVAQISKSIAKSLNLNDDLAETLAIAHDLGHAPFGHVGQDVLNELMQENGGFEHNLQALRIVDKIEKAYLDFEGLNLMFETREGLLKHCSKENASQLGEIARRHLTGKSSSLEAQVVNWCDAIAYNHADMEDGYNMGVLSLEQMLHLPLFKEHFDKVAEARKGKNDPQTDLNEQLIMASTLRSMFGEFAKNLLEQSRKNIEKSKVVTLNDVRNCEELISFSPEVASKHYQIKRFLRDNLYMHPDIQTEREMQQLILKTLFKKMVKNPTLLGNEYDPQNPDIHRQVCDYISGMTDRFAIAKCKSLQSLKKVVDMEKNPKYSLRFKN